MSSYVVVEIHDQIVRHGYNFKTWQEASDFIVMESKIAKRRGHHVSISNTTRAGWTTAAEGEAVELRLVPLIEGRKK